jgi:anti-anti-sigma regulatory factor
LGSERAEVRGDCCADHHCVELCRYALVELADSDPLRLACDQLLASARAFDPQQDPLRPISWAAGPVHVLAAPHDGAVGTDDPRGRRKVPSVHAESLRFIWIARLGAETLSTGMLLIAIRFLFAYNGTSSPFPSTRRGSRRRTVLTITVQNFGEVAIVRCQGRIVRGDETALLCAAVQQHGRNVILDFRRVDAIDAAGIDVLVSLQAAGVYLTLMNPTEQVHHVLRLTNWTPSSRSANLNRLTRYF